MNKNKLGNEGITLVELLLTISILGIALSIVFSFLQFNYTTFNKSSSNYNLQTSLTNAQRIIEKELKYAEDIRISNDGKRIEYDNNSIYLQEGEIVKKKPDTEIQITHKDIIEIHTLEFEFDGNLLLVEILGISPDGKLDHNIKFTIELLNYKYIV